MKHLKQRKPSIYKKCNVKSTTIIVVLAIIAIIILFCIQVHKQQQTLQVKSCIHHPRQQKIPYLDPMNRGRQATIKYKYYFEQKRKNSALNIGSKFIEQLSDKLDAVYMNTRRINSRTLSLQVIIFVSPEDFNQSLLLLKSLSNDYTIYWLEQIWHKIEMPMISYLSKIGSQHYSKENITFWNASIRILKNYHSYTELLFVIIIEYMSNDKELQYNMFYSHTIAIISIIKKHLEFVTISEVIYKSEFEEWQKVEQNRFKLLFISEFKRLVTGLPLFMLFLFIREEQVKSMCKDNRFLDKEDPAFDSVIIWLNNCNVYKKDKIDFMVGQIYKLFSMLEMIDLSNYQENIEESIMWILKEINDNLEEFLFNTKKLKRK